MRKQSTIAKAQEVMRELEEKTAALDDAQTQISILTALYCSMLSQVSELRSENEALRSDNIQMAKDLAGIDATFATKVVVDTQTKYVVTAKKPRKPSTRKAKPTRTDTTMAVMKETASLLAVNLPDVSEDEANQDIFGN